MARLTYCWLGKYTVGGTLQTENAVAIVIVNWNQKDRLATCLTSLRKNTSYPNYRTIVVDNGSKDGSAQMVTEQYPWADLIALDSNTGFSVGNNKGIVYALKKYDPAYVLLLNNDTKLYYCGWLGELVAAAQAQADIGIVGCKLLYPDCKTQYLGTKATAKGLSWISPSLEFSLPPEYNVDAVLGACFLIKRAVIDKIGLLDVGFSPFVHEESDYCFRAKAAGYRTRMVQTVAIIHYFRMSVSKVNSAYSESIVRRNFIRFMLLNFPSKWLLTRVKVELRILVSCFVDRNRGGALPVKLRTGRDLLVHLRINIGGWLYNAKRLHEILQKRQNRTMKLWTVE